MKNINLRIVFVAILVNISFFVLGLFFIESILDRNTVSIRAALFPASDVRDLQDQVGRLNGFTSQLDSKVEIISAVLEKKNLVTPSDIAILEKEEIELEEKFHQNFKTPQQSATAERATGDSGGTVK